MSLNRLLSERSAKRGNTPLMWSASMWVSTNSSNEDPSFVMRDASLCAVDAAPQSMRTRRGLFGSPYSIQRQSPFSAGSISTSKRTAEVLNFVDLGAGTFADLVASVGALGSPVVDDTVGARA